MAAPALGDAMPDRAKKTYEQLAEIAVPRAPEEFGDARLGSGNTLGRHAAQRVPLHELESGVGVREFLADHRVVQSSMMTREMASVSACVG